MTDFLTWIGAQSGLLACWPGDDASGSATARDVGANNLPLTKATGGTLGAPGFVNGIATSGRNDGTAASAFSRAVASNSTLDPHSAFSMGIWLKLTALPSSGTPEPIGRSSWATLRVLTSGVVRAQAAGNTAPPAGQPATGQTPFGIAVGETAFVVFTFGPTGEQRLYVNGAPAVTITRPGAFTASASAFFIGGVNGLAFDWAGAFLFGRELGASEVRDGYLAGITTPMTTFYVPSDDDPTATIATSGKDGNRMRATDPKIVTAAGDVFRADQYGATRQDQAHVWPASGDHATTVPRECCKQIVEQVTAYTTRAHTGDLIYHNGTKFVYAGSSTTFDRSTAGVVTALAALHRFTGLPKRRSWPLDLAAKHGDWLLTQQNASGQFFPALTTPDTWFVLNQLASAALIVGDDLGDGRLASWTTALELAGDYINSSSEQTYYVNGNIELMGALGFYLLYRLTGKSKWQTAYNSQWNAAMYATGITDSQRGGGAALATVGLLDGTAGTRIADDSALLAMSDTTGKAYLSESSGSNTYGLDWYYLSLQIGFASRLYAISGEARVKKLLNVLVNKALERLNTTTWVYDATGGTRQNQLVSWLAAGLEALMWPGYRGDLTYNLGSHWSDKVLLDFRNAQGTTNWANENYWVGLSDTMAEMLFVAPAWPGFRVDRR